MLSKLTLANRRQASAADRERTPLITAWRSDEVGAPAVTDWPTTCAQMQVDASSQAARDMCTTVDAVPLEGDKSLLIIAALMRSQLRNKPEKQPKLLAAGARRLAQRICAAHYVCCPTSSPLSELSVKEVLLGLMWADLQRPAPKVPALMDLATSRIDMLASTSQEARALVGQRLLK